MTKTTKATASKRDDTRILSALVAPEDITVGDWLAVLSSTREYPSWLYDSCSVPADQSVQIVERDSSGLPLKVKAICLPYLLTEEITGGSRVVDVRCSTVVRITNKFAKEFRKLQKEGSSNLVRS